MSNSYAPISAKLGQAWMMRDHIVGSATATLAASEAPDPMINSAQGSTPPLRPLRASLNSVMEEAGISPSTGRTGSCYDNAVTESFFASLETELIDRTRFATRVDAEREVFSYVEGFYNPWRRHSANSQLSPAEYERRHIQATQARPAELPQTA